jgi:hypothetical protein
VVSNPLQNVKQRCSFSYPIKFRTGRKNETEMRNTIACACDTIRQLNGCKQRLTRLHLLFDFLEPEFAKLSKFDAAIFIQINQTHGSFRFFRREVGRVLCTKAPELIFTQHSIIICNKDAIKEENMYALILMIQSFVALHFSLLYWLFGEQKAVAQTQPYG